MLVQEEIQKMYGDQSKEVITVDDIEYFKEWYNLDITAVDTNNVEILLDFRKAGPNIAIMRLIARLTKKEIASDTKEG